MHDILMSEYSLLEAEGKYQTCVSSKLYSLIYCLNSKQLSPTKRIKSLVILQGMPLMLLNFLRYFFTSQTLLKCCFNVKEKDFHLFLRHNQLCILVISPCLLSSGDVLQIIMMHEENIILTSIYNFLQFYFCFCLTAQWFCDDYTCMLYGNRISNLNNNKKNVVLNVVCQIQALHQQIF